MKYLLDTHAFLWCFEGSKKLGEKAKNILLEANTPKYISIASLWEFTIKYSLGNMPFEGGLSHLYDLIKHYDFIILPIKQQYLSNLMELPYIHRDPFDRLIISTALVDDMTIITTDSDIQKYDISWIW
ncbi:MAG: type II toxin-antitoxin system VapC family toxin [Oscillospiraceae bacterium]|nr:type II toxin-antitoxin system VapC family toxin [Oscillospiraceae bacterium]